MEPITWNDFISKVTEYRQSEGLLCGKLTDEDPDREVLIFGKDEAYLKLKDAKQIHFQVVRNVDTTFSSNICAVYIITEKKQVRSHM